MLAAALLLPQLQHQQISLSQDPRYTVLSFPSFPQAAGISESRQTDTISHVAMRYAVGLCIWCCRTHTGSSARSTTAVAVPQRYRRLPVTLAKRIRGGSWEADTEHEFQPYPPYHDGSAAATVEGLLVEQADTEPADTEPRDDSSPVSPETFGSLEGHHTDAGVKDASNMRAEVLVTRRILLIISGLTCISAAARAGGLTQSGEAQFTLHLGLLHLILVWFGDNRCVRSM